MWSFISKDAKQPFMQCEQEDTINTGIVNIIKEGACMRWNIKPITPQCGICKKLYSPRDEDGSGLCPKCRPLSVRYTKTERGCIIMQQKIMITELNKPSTRALKAFNQKKHYPCPHVSFVPVPMFRQSF